ncbi:MAG: leucine efflux protein LeuE [Betaproteobacteria bacterium]|nr:leucine efflux protein LeuE [Betaproteobacteria bacterium]
MYGITDLATFVVGTIFIVLLPGPNSLYVMTLASRLGVAAGYRGACGIFVGDSILMLLSATGVASLLHASPAVFVVIKYAGAAYLAWIGVGLIRAAVAMWRGKASNAPAPVLSQAADAAGVAGGASRPPERAFRTALIISLMNPKAILFFISFFIQFVDPGYDHPGLSFAILGLIVQVCSALYLSVLIYGGARLAAQFRRRRRLSAGATGGVGAMFIGFGVKLANATLA